MRISAMILAVFMVAPLSSVAAGEAPDKAMRALIHSGARVLRLDQPGYPRMLNYYHSVPVYQARSRDLRNPLFLTTRRNESGAQRLYRAVEFHIPLFRGTSRWKHLEVVDAIRINAAGESLDKGYRRFALPDGDGGAGIAPVRFHESVPEGTAEGAASGPDAGSRSSGSGDTARPELSASRREAVESGLVVRRFRGDRTAVFDPVYVYDDFLYVRRNKQRYRVLYTLEPMYPHGDERGREYLVGFPAEGGPLALMAAGDVRIENGFIRFAGGGSQPSGAVVAFNAADCPEGWAEYEPAYGRFVRGLDKSGENIDPAGERDPGNLQDDALGWHKHQLLSKHEGFYTKGAFRSHGTHGGRPFERNQKTTGTGGKETRPRNVALLYCEKQ